MGHVHARQCHQGANRGCTRRLWLAKRQRMQCLLTHHEHLRVHACLDSHPFQGQYITWSKRAGGNPAIVVLYEGWQAVIGRRWRVHSSRAAC